VHIIYDVFDDFFLSIGQGEWKSRNNIFYDIPVRDCRYVWSFSDSSSCVSSLVHQGMELHSQQSIKKYPLNSFFLEFHSFGKVHIFDRIDYSDKIEFLEKFFRKIFVNIVLRMCYQVPSFLSKPPRANAIQFRINWINSSCIICRISRPVKGRVRSGFVILVPCYFFFRRFRFHYIRMRKCHFPGPQSRLADDDISMSFNQSRGHITGIE